MEIPTLESLVYVVAVLDVKQVDLWVFSICFRAMTNAGLYTQFQFTVMTLNWSILRPENVF